VAPKNPKPALFVKRSESKKGALWNRLTNDRIIRQHGGYDIPEGDLHAVKKFESPIQFPQASQEETDSALKELADEIEGLKKKSDQLAPPRHTRYDEDEVLNENEE